MRYFVRAIVFFVLTLWAAITLNFIIPRLQAGDPAEAIVQQISRPDQRSIRPRSRRSGDARASPIRTLFQQYVDYLRHYLRGEFGISYSYFPYTVTHMIGEALPWTLVLVGVTHILRFVVGTLLGAWAAWRRNSTFDYGRHLGSTFFGTLPFFWIALLLLYVFAFQLGWFPDRRRLQRRAPTRAGTGPSSSTPPSTAVLPARWRS